MSRRTALSLVAAVSALGCRHASEAPPPARLSLPDALGPFAAASPPVTGPGWVRRGYRRAGAEVEVTLAETSLPPGGFDSWVGMSRAFPQAALDAPASDANGFYQCTERPAPGCDLLIQLRSGVHVELRGHGSSSRADVDTIAAGLPLRALAVAAKGGS